jgi:hypothetical protein
MEIVIAVLQTGLPKHFWNFVLKGLINFTHNSHLILFGIMPVSKMFFFSLCWHRYTVRHLRQYIALLLCLHGVKLRVSGEN